MQVAAWALRGMVGWTAIGALGTWASLARRERGKAWRGMGWIVGVWVCYLGVVVGVGRYQGQKVLGRGEEECFGEVCFTVSGVREVGEFKGAGGGRVVTVAVRMVNRGADGAGVEGLRGYLVDGRGREWAETAGVGGVALSARVPAGRETESAPVFRVDGDAAGLGLVLTRGGWGRLRVGDTDSLGHRPTVLRVR